MSGWRPLPNAHAAFVADAKVRDYLLNPQHPGNGGKATFFMSFGFSLGDWPKLAAALRQHAISHAYSVTRFRPNPYGMRYEIRGSANVLTLARVADSLAGRMETIQMLPLARAEVAGRFGETSQQHELSKIIAGLRPEPPLGRRLGHPVELPPLNRTRGRLRLAADEFTR